MAPRKPPVPDVVVDLGTMLKVVGVALLLAGAMAAGGLAMVYAIGQLAPIA